MNSDSDLVPLTHEPLATRPGGGRRAFAWVAAALLLLAGLALTTAALLPVREQVPANTYVAGVALGGLDRSQVQTALAGPVAAKLGTTVRLLVGQETIEVSPGDAGITLNRTATERALLKGVPETLLDRLRGRLRDRGSPAKRHDVAAVLAVNQSAAKKTISALVSPFNRDVKDATLTLPTPTEVLTEKGTVSFTATASGASVVPAVVGRRVDVDAAVATLRAAVAGQKTQLPLTVVETNPKISTAEATGVDQLIGTFTTAHPCCAPRVTNIHRIAEIVDGSVIAPGATFSLNAAAGRRTAENGFVSAPAIADGELVEQFGGGVSQFSTTLFNAAWFAGLPILSHQPHSEYISRYPPGREATLDFDTIDQTIRNDTGSPVVIRTSTTGTSVTVALYGHTGNRTVNSTTGARVPRTGGGFSITVQRVVLDAGTEHRRDTLNWSYKGVD